MPYWRTHGGVIPPPALALNGRLSMGGLEAMSAKIFLPPLEKILWGGGQIIFRLFRRCKTDPKGVKKSKCTAVTIIYPPYFFLPKRLPPDQTSHSSGARGYAPPIHNPHITPHEIGQLRPWLHTQLGGIPPPLSFQTLHTLTYKVDGYYQGILNNNKLNWKHMQMMRNYNHDFSTK